MTTATPDRSAGPPPPGAGQYLTFSLGEQVFGMQITDVREIIQYRTMTTVPRMPAFVRGMINLRGSVVPVIDLHARFGLGEAAIGKKSCNVIFDVVRGGERVELGLLVDAVSAVVTIAPDSLEPPPAFGAAVPRDFIAGLGRAGQGFVTLLDPDRALDLDEMARLCDAAQGVAAA